MARKRNLLIQDPDLEPEFDDDELLGDEYDADDDDDEYGSTSAVDGAGFSFAAADIADICGAVNARRGLALFLRGAVGTCTFDGHAIRAKVAAEPGVADASYNFDQQAHQCSSPADDGRTDRGCVHVAALLYAWQRAPESFEIANLGAMLELFTRQPELFVGSHMDPSFLEPIAALWEDAPTALRDRISQMPVRGSPEQAAELAGLLQELSQQSADQEFADLLGRLSLEQLRAIAKQRRFPLRATAKAKASAELIDHLRASPLPETFSPEEEQLVRIENTLWGLETLPSHQNLLADWQAHAGGNLARLEHALQGLQRSGVLFPCTGEGLGLHYHWSPFLRSAMLPLFQPNVALAPVKGAQAPATSLPRRGAESGEFAARGQEATSLPRRGAESSELSAGEQSPLPLLTLLDAVLTFAEREPLRVRPPVSDPRLDHTQWVGPWTYLPEELTALLAPRGGRRQVPAALTVPFRSYFTDETLDALAALAGGMREYGSWAALMLVLVGVIQPITKGGSSPDFHLPPAAMSSPSAAQDASPREASPEATTSLMLEVDPARLSAWQLLSPDQQFERLWGVWCEGAGAMNAFRLALEDKGFIVRRSTYDAELTPQTLSQEMGLARKFVARVLAMLAPQTWYAWPAFASCIRKLRSSFFYTYTGPHEWWLEHAPSAKRYEISNPQHWDAAWLPVLQSMLTGPLTWFGAIEVNDLSAARGQDASSVQRRGAESRGLAARGQDASNVQRRGAESSELSAFRITPLGAWLFTEGRQGRVPPFAAAVAVEGPPFEWLDETTFRVRATPDAMRALAPLRVYVEPTRQLLTFRVSLPAIGRALAQAASAASITEEFAAAGLPLAPAVQALIETLVARSGRLNLYERVTVLELGDDIALRELLATTALRAHIVHVFSPRLVVVRDEAVETLLAELVRKGHTPLLS